MFNIITYGSLFFSVGGEEHGDLFVYKELKKLQNKVFQLKGIHFKNAEQCDFS